MSLTSFGSIGQYLFGGIIPYAGDNLDFEAPFGLADNTVTSIGDSLNNTSIIPKWTCAGEGMSFFRNRTVTYMSYSGTQLLSFNGTINSMSIIHDGVLLQAGTYVIDYYVGSAGNGAGGMGVTVSYSINGGTTWILRSTKATPYFGGASQSTDATSAACKVSSSSFTIAAETLVQLKIATIPEGTSVNSTRTVIKNFSFRAI